MEIKEKRFKILLIEDNPGDVRLIREMLKEAGADLFELKYVDRLSLGLEFLKEEDFDVILLDLGLPDSQGIATLTGTLAQTSKVPVVVLTGLADDVLGVRAVHEEAQDYLIKGQLDGKLLVRSIRYAIERKRMEKEKEKLQEQLYHAKKVEAVGKLAGAIAHDFNNSLSEIIRHGELLLEKVKEDDESRNYVQKILTTAEQATDLIRGLLFIQQETSDRSKISKNW